MRGHHGEREALHDIEQAIAKSTADDKRRDTATLKALLAIGRITFARFDNTDKQLDRIEAAILAVAENSGTAEQLAALTERLQAADARFDAAAPAE